VALQTGPLTVRQVQWLAVLDGGPGCVLGGISALHAHGLAGFPLDRVQTLVPPGSRPTATPLFLRRQSRRLTPEAIHPAKKPPCLRVGPALVDALARIELPMRGCALMAVVVQQRLLSASEVVRLALAERTMPNRAIYVAVAGDIEGGSHSLLEIDFVELARQAGLPPPIRQSARTDHDGHRPLSRCRLRHVRGRGGRRRSPEAGHVVGRHGSAERNRA
jgi:hypothetical protein